jgi:hypothetical protein
MPFTFCKKECKGRDKTLILERKQRMTLAESKILTVVYY